MEVVVPLAAIKNHVSLISLRYLINGLLLHLIFGFLENRWRSVVLKK